MEHRRSAKSHGGNEHDSSSIAQIAPAYPNLRLISVRLSRPFKLIAACLHGAKRLPRIWTRSNEMPVNHNAVAWGRTLAPDGAGWPAPVLMPDAKRAFFLKGRWEEVARDEPRPADLHHTDCLRASLGFVRYGPATVDCLPVPSTTPLPTSAPPGALRRLATSHEVSWPRAGEPSRNCSSRAKASGCGPAFRPARGKSR